MDQQKTGDFLRELRKKKEMTQEQFAEIVIVHRFLLAAAILWIISLVISHTELAENSVLSNLSNFSEGLAAGMLLCGIIVTSRYGQKIRAFKERLVKKH